MFYIILAVAVATAIVAHRVFCWLVDNVGCKVPLPSISMVTLTQQKREFRERKELDEHIAAPKHDDELIRELRIHPVARECGLQAADRLEFFIKLVARMEKQLAVAWAPVTFEEAERAMNHPADNDGTVRVSVIEQFLALRHEAALAAREGK